MKTHKSAQSGAAHDAHASRVNPPRRVFLLTAAAVAAATLAGIAPRAWSAASAAQRMKIGVIGSGRIGGTLGALWAKAGHDVMFADTNPDALKRAVESLGANARTGTSREAAAFGDVVLISVPYAALPQIGRELGSELKGKVVLDPANPIASRDGDIVAEARAKGAGVMSASLLPGVRLVRAFNSVGFTALRSEAHRPSPRVAIPLASDDDGALKIAARLVEDAGFEPVLAGPLARAREFDVGTPGFGRAITAAEWRKILGITP